MVQTRSQRFAEFLAGVVGLARRFAVVVALATLALTAATGYFVATHVAINTDTSEMLSADLPFRKDARALDHAFPQFSDNILIVVDGIDADTTSQAADALTRELKRHPDLFSDVFDAAADPFFRKNGLLYLDVDELSDLADQLAAAQPLLGTLWRDPSLRGLSDVLVLAMEESDKNSDSPVLELDRVFAAMADVVEAQNAGRPGRLSWQELMSGGDADESDRRRLIVLRPVLDYSSLQPGEKAISAIRKIARELHLNEANGVRVRLTGSTPLAEEELQSVIDGLGLAGILSLVLVIGLLFWGLKSPRLVLATLITLVVGLIWTAAFAVGVVGKLNLISVAFAVLFIGLSVDFGIHFCLRYREDRNAGEPHRVALAAAGRGVGGALTLSAVAAAIAFFSFLPTDYVGLAELGLIAGAGMFIALIANLTVLPAMMTLLTPGVPKRAAAPAQHAAGIAFPRRHARLILTGAGIVAIVAIVLFPRVTFDFDPLNLKDASTESVSTLFDLMKDKRTGPYSITILAKNLDAANALAKRIDKLDGVDATETLSDYVPKNQDEKLPIIEDMALFLSPSFASTEHDPPPSPAERAAALSKFRSALRTYIANNKAGTGARRLDAALTAFDAAGGGDAALAELEKRLLQTLPSQLTALRESLNAEPVTLASIPKALSAREVAADGRARLKVYPAEDIRDRDAMRRFVETVRSVAPNATGGPVIILEAGNAIVRAFAEAAVISIVLISILLIVLLRRARDVILVFAPLILAALMTVAASVLLDMPFNFANVIVLPLLFGLGVAGNIHLVLRERDDAGAADVLGTSTPRAVVFSALTTIGSFGSIALSSHPGTSSMGLLLTVAISLTLVTALIVLPAMMTVWPPKPPSKA